MLIVAGFVQMRQPPRLADTAFCGQPTTLRFLRLRNRERCDIYLQPFAGNQNAGYILVDLDAAPPAVLEAMRRSGHEPCVVLQSSPGHWQAWIRVSLFLDCVDCVGRAAPFRRPAQPPIPLNHQ